VWVSNSQSKTALRFPADDPSKVETFRVGISVRGVALDSKGNLWVASLLSPDFRIPKRMPEGITIMEQFRLIAEAMKPFSGLDSTDMTGVVNLIRADGSQPAPDGYRAGGLINGPLGMAIDGKGRRLYCHIWRCSPSEDPADGPCDATVKFCLARLNAEPSWLRMIA
jgi:hypothetical protein